MSDPATRDQGGVPRGKFCEHETTPVKDALSFPPLPLQFSLGRLCKGDGLSRAPGSDSWHRLFFYGETAAVYLLGAKAAMPYRIVWVILAYFGAVGSLHLMWDIADTLNGLMAIPNLIAVLGCSRLIVQMQKEFFSTGRKERDQN